MCLKLKTETFEIQKQNRRNFQILVKKRKENGEKERYKINTQSRNAKFLRAIDAIKYKQCCNNRLVQNQSTFQKPSFQSK